MDADLGRAYRPHLDGVRAVAIVLVLAQHVLGTMDAFLGATGVGLFFALSGYLITGLLLDEHARSGTLQLRRFYLRRLARLGPGLLFMIVVVGSLLVASHRADLLAGALPALLYVTNYTSILGWTSEPFGHTWSLAVEEHFYLVWPVILLLLLRRRSLRTAALVTFGLCGLTLAWRCVLTATVQLPFGFLYWDSISRGDSLLFGCAAAMLVRLGWRPPAWVGPWGALGLVLLVAKTPVVSVGVLASAFTGIVGAMFVVGIDEAGGRLMSSCRSMLARRSIVGLGQISYGVYLWHLPLIVIFAQPLGGGPALRLIVVLASVPVAWVSYRLVEVPARTWARPRIDALRGRAPASVNGGFPADGELRPLAAST